MFGGETEPEDVHRIAHRGLEAGGEALEVFDRLAGEHFAWGAAERGAERIVGHGHERLGDKLRGGGCRGAERVAELRLHA